MDPYFYDRMFNPQYVNAEYYHQVEQQMHYEAHQNKKVADAVKAMHDLCDAVKDMDQNHQDITFRLCLFELAKVFGWK